MSVVISLSSIPSRFSQIGIVLERLLAQDIQKFRVELYIPKRFRRFPDHSGVLPEVPRGVEIVQVEEDLGPATKVLYAADRYNGSAIDILFCDDDRITETNWARGFVETRLARPNDAIVASGFDFGELGLADFSGMKMPRAIKSKRMFDWQRHFKTLIKSWQYGGINNVPWHEKPTFLKFKKPGFVAIGEGFGGFMIKPHFLNRSMWEIPAVLWAVDDVWISGHLNSQGIDIWAMDKLPRSHAGELDRLDALHNAIIDGKGRGEANIECVRFMQKNYGSWGG